MKLSAPIYYKDFKCTADKCRHSCCVGWEIEVDRDTLARYESLGGGYSKEILDSIEGGADSAGFRLTESGRCPHLTENGLCRIICRIGEGYLCDICREHPRFYNSTANGEEVGIGAVCEAAAELILECRDYRAMILLGETDGEPYEMDFDAPAARARVYSVLSDSSLPYKQRLRTLWEGYGVAPERLTDKEWRELLLKLEYMNEEHKILFSSHYSSNPDYPAEEEEHLERFLAYLIYRHTGAVESEAEFRSALGFAFFLERLLASLLSHNSEACTSELVRIISEELEYSEDNTEAISLEFI